MSESQETNCYGMPIPRTRWQRFRDRLFPSRYCELPDAPETYKDCLHGSAVTKLKFVDRLRVLVTGVVIVQWRTVTENVVGGAVTNAVCYIGTSQKRDN